jgi:predicted acylesterase/phospholipase RssA
MQPSFPVLSPASDTRPRTGLVLGAGGIRGCAHAGVIAVLREAEVPVDLVVGASVGAMFGVAVAAGRPSERIVQAVRDTRPRDIFSFYAGRLRTTRSNPIARLLLDAAGGKTFDDLEIPFAVVATDMATGKLGVIDRGPVLQAVQAGIALPFIARPVPWEGAHYLDGGMVDTAPVSVARAMGADRVIAVCLGYNYAAPLALRRRPWTRNLLDLLGRQQRPPGGSLLDQVRFMFRLYAALYDPPLPAQDADIAIWPELGRLNPNSIFGADLALEAGFQAAREAVAQHELSPR